jgi:aminoglycoside/choline kinase family phosphotransferase
LSYDLVSILRDAYIEWPEAQTLDWTVRYWEAARKAGLPICEDPGEFYRQFDFMGLQRHLKILGIFARLNYRDGKAQYLNDLPMVLRYVRLVAGRYIAFKPLLLLLDRLENKAVKVGYTF